MSKKIEKYKSEDWLHEFTMPLKYIRNENGDFVCPECGIIKKRQNSMHYHMKKHLDELNHVCDICKKAFLQKQTLDLHIRSKHPQIIEHEPKNKFKCTFDNCEFTALTKGNCIVHCFRTHFQDEIKEIININNETKIISCNECNNEFHSSSSFYYHVKNCIKLDKSDSKYKKLQEMI